MPTRYVALLRGINVGGNNLIKMSDLKAAFESLGLENVATFIASGNVLFDAPAKKSPARLTPVLEAALSKRFGYASRLELRSHQELERIIAARPKGFGDAPAKYRYDVVFLIEPLTPAVAISKLSLKEGVDQVWAGPRVLYFSRLVARAAQSRLSKVASMPIYQSMTIRNWNTTSKLHALSSA